MWRGPLTAWLIYKSAGESPCFFLLLGSQVCNSPPASRLALAARSSLLAPRPSPLVTRHSLLVTRCTPLAARDSGLDVPSISDRPSRKTNWNATRSGQADAHRRGAQRPSNHTAYPSPSASGVQSSQARNRRERGIAATAAASPGRSVPGPGLGPASQGPCRRARLHQSSQSCRNGSAGPGPPATSHAHGFAVRAAGPAGCHTSIGRELKGPVFGRKAAGRVGAKSGRCRALRQEALWLGADGRPGVSGTICIKVCHTRIPCSGAFVSFGKQ